MHVFEHVCTCVCVFTVPVDGCTHGDTLLGIEVPSAGMEDPSPSNSISTKGDVQTFSNLSLSFPLPLLTYLLSSNLSQIYHRIQLTYSPSILSFQCVIYHYR